MTVLTEMTYPWDHVEIELAVSRGLSVRAT